MVAGGTNTIITCGGADYAVYHSVYDRWVDHKRVVAVGLLMHDVSHVHCAA